MDDKTFKDGITDLKFLTERARELTLKLLASVGGELPVQTVPAQSIVNGKTTILSEYDAIDYYAERAVTAMCGFRIDN